MTHTVDEVMLLLGGSLAASIVAKATVISTLGLFGAWLARERRAAVRHALLASAFSVLLALPIVSFLATPVPIAMPVAKGDSNISPLSDYISVPSSAEPGAERFSAAPAKPGWLLFPLSTILPYGWFRSAVSDRAPAPPQNTRRRLGGKGH